MKAWFCVKFTDYFGFEHETWVWTYGSESAIAIAKDEFGYPMTINSVSIAWNYRGY